MVNINCNSRFEEELGNGLSNAQMEFDLARDDLTLAESLPSRVWGHSSSFVNPSQPCRIRSAAGLESCITSSLGQKCIFKRAASRRVIMPVCPCRVMRRCTATGASGRILDVPTRKQAYNSNLFVPRSHYNNRVFFIESSEYANECFQDPSSQSDPFFDFSEFFVPQQASPLSLLPNHPYSPQPQALCDQNSLYYCNGVSSPACSSVASQKFELDNAESPYSILSSGYHSTSPDSIISEKSFYEMIDDMVESVRLEIRAESKLMICGNVNEPNFARKAPKRKFSHDSQPSSSESSLSNSVEENQVPAKRGKKFCLAGLSHEEIAERKKEQNRIAAQRYRSKKSNAFHSEVSEIEYLEKRNADLKQEELGLAAEIRQLKDLMVTKLSTSLSQK